MHVAFSAIPELEYSTSIPSHLLKAYKQQLVFQGSTHFYQNELVHVLSQNNSTSIYKVYNLNVFNDCCIKVMTDCLLVSLVYMLKGNSTFQFASQVQARLPEGYYQLFAMQPKDQIAVFLESGTYCCFQLIMDIDWLMALNGEHPSIEKFMQHLATESKSLKMGEVFRINKKMLQLIEEILQCREAKMTLESILKEKKSGLVNFFLKDVSNYWQHQLHLENIEKRPDGLKHYLSEMIHGTDTDSDTIAEIIQKIANRLLVPAYRIKKQFRMQHRITLHDYIKTLRMEKVASLLKESSQPIATIALISGYKDFSSFTRAFVQHFGMNPSQYRSSKSNS